MPFGDLNFRVDLPRKAVETAIASKDYQTLMAKDELYMHGMKNSVLKQC